MSVPRLVVHENPEGRLTPVLLLAELRAIDPRVELVYLGARDWCLGSVALPESPSRDIRAKKADFMLTQFRIATAEGHKVDPKTYMVALLNKQGFAQIARYTDHGDVSGSVTAMGQPSPTSVLHHFRDIQSQWLSDGGEAAFKRTLAVADGSVAREHQRQRAAEYLAADGRAIYARVFRDKKSFGRGGMTGGRGRILTPGSYSPTGPIVTAEEGLAEIEELMASLAAN